MQGSPYTVLCALTCPIAQAGRWPSGIQRAGEPPCTVACSTARRRHSVLCMASVAPTPPEDDGEESSPDGNGQSDGAGSSQPDDSNQDAKESETRPFFGAFMEQAPRSKPLMDGDSLPLSFRSDNGTRESEFYLEESEKHLNPYYDVVRRLSPTELIGRFMRTASPRVSKHVVCDSLCRNANLCGVRHSCKCQPCLH